ncbi:hypothetical protein ANN_03144 [Periplaneta americana]|uniref:Uncharacterized protein n=1 Tax=Periplaneta americana TaxID=6978 RepID=A0ABQ8TY75_PERAM|nr:hypothetical protein ANN_03144 [Periplaneta americana]
MGIRCGLVDKASARRAENPGSNPDVAQVVALIESGNSQRYVAAAVLGIPRSTVQRVYHRFRETGDYSRRPGSGRKRVTSARDDHFIVLNTLRNRHSTAIETRRAFQKIRQDNVSERTVRGRLDECGLIPEDQLKAQNCSSNIMLNDYVLLTIMLIGNCSRVSFQGGSVMVWGGISYEAHAELVFINGGALTAPRYIEEVAVAAVVVVEIVAAVAVVAAAVVVVVVVVVVVATIVAAAVTVAAAIAVVTAATVVIIVVVAAAAAVVVVITAAVVVTVAAVMTIVAAIVTAVAAAIVVVAAAAAVAPIVVAVAVATAVAVVVLETAVVIFYSMTLPNFRCYLTSQLNSLEYTVKEIEDNKEDLELD